MHSPQPVQASASIPGVGDRPTAGAKRIASGSQASLHEWQKIPFRVRQVGLMRAMTKGDGDSGLDSQSPLRNCARVTLLIIRYRGSRYSLLSFGRAPVYTAAIPQENSEHRCDYFKYEELRIGSVVFHQH